MSRLFDIRAATPGEAGRVSGLAGRTFRAAYTDLSDEEVRRYCRDVLSVCRFRAVLERPDSLVLLAVSTSGEELGYAQLEPNEAPPVIESARPVELVRIYLEQKALRRGLGSALLDKCLAWAHSREHDSCWARVWDQNPGAAAFYRSRGFSVVGAEPYLAGGMDDRVWLMRKNLHRGVRQSD